MSYTFLWLKETTKCQRCAVRTSWEGAMQWKTMEVIIYYIDTIMVYIQLQLKVKPSYPPPHCCRALYNSFLSSCVQRARLENGPVFSDALRVVRDASCWTSDSYRVIFGGGVDGAETRARVVEKKRSLCSWPSRLKTRPGCCALSRHCLLKCWHLGLNEGFNFSQNILEMQYGNRPLFSCANLTTLNFVL